MKRSTSSFQSEVYTYLHSSARRLAWFAALAAILLARTTALSQPQSDDLLLRLDPGQAIFSNPPYERLCTENLFVTPGEVARYFFVPAFKDAEIVVSVSRATRRAGSLPGNYWLTVTQPLRRIAMPSNSRRLKIRRRDSPIPESTARAVHKVWLAMLQSARPRTRLDMELDSDAMFFYSNDDAGKTLRGERFGTGSNVMALVDIGGMLITYGYATAAQRTALAREIEAKASVLYQRVH
jgi:hypothetical protein